MKQLNFLLLMFIFVGQGFGQGKKTVKDQSIKPDPELAILAKQLPTPYVRAKMAAYRIRLYNLNDKAQLARWDLAIDSLVTAIPKLATYDQSCDVLGILSNSYYYDHPRLIQLLDRITAYYKNNNFMYGVFYARKELADMHLRESKIQLAETEMIQLIRDYEKTNLPNITTSYDLLSGIYLNKGDIKSALKYALMTIEHVKSTNDSLNLPNFYNRLAEVYIYMNNPIALEYMNKIADYSKRNGKPKAFYFYIQVFASFFKYFHKGSEGLHVISDFYRKYPPESDQDKRTFYLAAATLNLSTKQNKQAEKYFNKNIALTEKMLKSGDLRAEDANYRDIGAYLFNNHQYDMASKYLTLSLNYPANGYPSAKPAATYQLLSYIDSLHGNYKSALTYTKKILRFRDSIYNVEKSKQIEELNLAYQTAQKEKAINVLREKERMQQIKLKQSEVTRNWMFGGSFLLLALLAVSYRGFRLKQKNSEMLAQKNILLQRLISEKEWLLKEVHHRVKNNLHTVICLLESQAVYLENDALKAIENSQHRIYAMSLIHQKLYQSDDIKTIDMSVYLPEFIHYLNESFDTQRKVRFHLDVQPVELGVAQAIPLALIVNEAVTNAIKYAFVNKETGLISVSMKAVKNKITLCIADNGVGIEPLTTMSSKSLGMKLMHGLSEDINAQIIIRNDEGTRITVVFDSDPLFNEREMDNSLIAQT